ncbi:MAG: hypothetical protein ACRC0C_02965 [Gibbsiella quercinecans]
MGEVNAGLGGVVISIAEVIRLCWSIMITRPALIIARVIAISSRYPHSSAKLEANAAASLSA